MTNQCNATRLLINGLVQGVGFRPTVHLVARELKLNGWVKNTSQGVEVVIDATDYQPFLQLLEAKLPHLASLDSIEATVISLPQPLTKFTIESSIAGEVNDTIMPPDNYICQDCTQEIFDPNSKYYLYPFTNCTNCGPRYSVIAKLPYDRQHTALANYPLCASCQNEYTNPDNRRYHAQATACPKCGPQLNGNLEQVANWIKQGMVVAIKGIGGYVLVADANNHDAVEKLRIRKKRKSKPFAIMCLNTDSIRHFYSPVSEHEAGLLESAAAPILLLKKRHDAKVAYNVAPNLSTLGIMLPSSPLFLILFYYLLGKPQGNDWLKQLHSISLVVTSANFSGGTIISDDEEAKTQLTSIADKIISHDREIIMKNDDSVLLSLGKHDILVRRSRGYAPKPYYFPYKMPQVLGLGAQLKNTITFTRDNKAFTSQYLGDMESPYTVKYFKQVLNHLQKVFNFQPELVVCDLHPDFYVTQYAQSMDTRYIQLQHHCAHMASALANAESYGRRLEPQVLGCILDGYGYGLNGESCGGELILFNQDELTFNTISQLMPITIPGGDLAEREPWRLALALCVENNLPIPEHINAQPQSTQLIELINRKYYPTSTAFGRRFSAVAGLLNIVTHAEYEAQAPMVLEGMVTAHEIAYEYIRINKDGKPDFNTLFKHIYQIGIIDKNIKQAVNVFYGNMLALVEKWLLFHCSTHQISQVAISGGGWQCQHLLPNLSKNFKNLGIDLLVPYQMPMNDESISLGQAWYGAKFLMKEQKTCV